MTVTDQAWVTYAKDGESATKSLVLLRSLRRVLTSRKVVIILSENVPTRLREIIEEEFDAFFSISGNNSDLSQIKLFCWSLPIFRRCIYLDPNSFVLRNCDHFFENDVNFYAPLDKDGNLDTSMFLLSPGTKMYKKLVNEFGTSEIQDFGSAVAGYFKTEMEILDGQFGLDHVDIQNGKLVKNETEIFALTFVNQHPLNIGKTEDNKMGILERAIFQVWQQLYQEQVKPVLEGQNRLPNPLDEFADVPNEPIAIIGMSCRYPSANSLSEFWQLIFEGKDGIRQVTPDRWTKDQGCHMSGDMKTTQAGFLNCTIDEFDGKFFGISPMEMSFLDPQTRILLEVIWESLEDAGISTSSLKNTYSGVYIGEWTNDYKELIREQGYKEFYRTYMGNSPGSAAGRISFLLGLTGPSVATESGCSSAMVAMDLAIKSLRLGETRVCIAAGVNLLLHPFSTKDMSMVCAPDGHCKTFDAAADGFGRAEGCGSLILKRYSDAMNDGDHIWAVIRGTGSAQEGPSRSLGTPTVACEALAMKRALINSGVKPNRISYVETHGTGTPVGDPMEVAAIAQVYSEGRKEPLIIGSVKTNVGHTESCSGITGIMKVVLSLQNEVIPPHRNFETLNPHVKLEAVPAEIPLTPTEWKKNPAKARYAGVSSFGITGTDAHAIIQETPQVCQPKLTLELKNRPHHVLTISAKNEVALDDLIKQYIKQLEQNKNNLELADVAFSANTGRAHHQHRVAVIGRHLEDILEKLENNAYIQQQCPENKPKLCFLFTGQGSQFKGMAKSLYETAPVFRMHFDKCEQLLREKYSVDIKSALWEDEENNNDITRTIYSQTSIFCVEYCMSQLWESFGIKPDCVVGHSLGEFAAACSAGILTLEDAMELVAERSRLIDSLPGGKMVAIKAGKKTVESALEKFLKINPDKHLDYAAINSNDQTVLAGSTEAVEAFTVLCSNNNIKTHVLGSTHAFHSKDMEPILPEYRQVASKIVYKKPNCTYISGMDANVITEEEEITADYWVRHTRESVKFLEASKLSYQEGCRMYLEVGPQPVLSALTMGNCGDLGEQISCLPSLRKNEEEWQTMLGTLTKLYINGFDIDWKGFDQYLSRKKVTLPFYPFHSNRKHYWFELKAIPGMINGTELHPLIGCPVPNATAVKMYQTALDIKNKELYIKDHCIGTKVIFPAAGYMEMVLAAGHATTQCCVDSLPTPGTPLTVQNLAIEAPLCVNESEACELQILVSSEEMTSVGSKVSIYRKVNADDTSNIKWYRHAQGEFSPFAVEYQDTAEAFQEIQGRCNEVVELANFYETLSKIGLKFGDTFRSIKSVKKGDRELVSEIAIPEQANDYLCHPVIIDSLIQTIMLSKVTDKITEQKLVVPISIKKFIWLGKVEDAQALYVHCSPESESTPDAIQASLYDDQGRKLAVMIGAELIETSVDVILSAIEQQKRSLPNLYEDAWRPTAGPLFGRIPLENLTQNTDAERFVYNDPSGNRIVYDQGWDEHEKRLVELSDKLTYLYIAQAFLDLGWDPEVGDIFTLQPFLSSLHILETHEKLIKHLLNSIFVEEGIVKSVGEGEWELLACVPNKSDIGIEITNIHAEIEIHKKKDFQMIAAIGETFARIISGKESALSILFPEDPTKISADVFYTETNVSRVVNTINAEILKNILSKIETNPDKKEIVRFLEIGSGTGSTTKSLLPLIDESKLKYEYTFTDISQMFFTKAKKGFEAYEKNMKYKVLNIEDDPKAQGFVPHTYDIVIASNVLHATRDLSVSVANLRHLLRNSGIVVLIETNKPMKHIDMIFGVLEGYWIFTDFDLRPNHTAISGKQWEQVFKKSGGIDSTISLTRYDDQQTIVIGLASASTPIYRPSQIAQERASTWLLLTEDGEFSEFFKRKLENVGKNVVIATASQSFKKVNPQRFEIRPEDKTDMENLLQSFQNKEGGGSQVEGILYLWGLVNEQKDQQNISQAFLNLSQILLGGKYKTYPRCYVFTGGIMPVIDQGPTNPSAGTLWGLSRSLRSEQPNLTCRCIDTTLDEVTEESLEELFMEIWNEDGENQVAYREGKRFVVRFVATKLSFTDLPIPNSNRFALTLPATKTINDLKFDVRGAQQLQGNEIELQVKAAGLNFRDVFNVLKPDAQFEHPNCNSVGADFAGVVTALGPECSKLKIGDYVVGCNFEQGALPSHVKTLEDAVVPLPEKLTFAEGCTLPAVFSTAYYCLVTIGKLQAGETILIHTASGGVGICSIQLARWLGAKVIATAGSKRKRSYLKSLGIEHVFHSRNLSFGADIERVTEGRGVDMVLNSITGVGFKEESLKSCAKNARFVEMSKLSIWQPEEVKAMRPDVEYTIVDLTAISKDEWKSLFCHLNEFLQKEMFQPIPYVRFNGVNIREALTYLQKAKHVGKVVCIMPEMEIKNGEYVSKTPMFNDRSTYIITGGLGGIGIEVAKWMISSGAHHVVLVGRSEPGEVAERTINELKATGKNIIVEKCDVGDFEQCKQMIEKLCAEESGLPPIRGVMHAAGCLSDAIIVNQSWEKFEKTFNAKVKGGWNLHQLTLNFPLEHFVMFSSVVALFGPLGQSNHSAANSYLDALAHYRIASGLTATSVNWGQWGQVGVAAGMEVAGLIPFSPVQGIAALEAVMKAQRSQIAVLEADFAAIRRLFPQTKKYVEELKLLADAGVQIKISSEKFWQEYDSADEDNRPKVVQAYIENILRQILKLDKNEPIDENQNLQEMGLDSLMMVEMKNFLQTLMGNRVTITASSLQDCHNLHDLTNRLVDLIEGAEENDTRVPLTRDELTQLIREDSTLPETIVPSEKTHCKPSEVRVVLLTGATGNLGPYVLKNLSNLQQIEKIYCLIRYNRKVPPMDRLRAAMESKDLLTVTNFEKIECIEGNLGDNMFGLSEEFYMKLCDEVDGIMHCAVKTNQIESYRPSEKSKRDMRTINVFGTVKVLEFATTGKTKLVAHSSTMLTFTKSTTTGQLPEEYPDAEDFDNVANVGYGITKFVCERLMCQATERGIPVKSLRFPNFSGDSKTGHRSMQDNHLLQRMLCYMKLGVMPSLPLPLQILPVDTCAEIAVTLYLNDQAPFDVFNITNPNCTLEQSFVKLSEEFGFKVVVIEYADFIARLEEEGENSSLYPLRKLYFNEETFKALSASPELVKSLVMQLASGNASNFFKSAKLQRLIPEILDRMEVSTDILRRDLIYAKKIGVFKTFGLES